MKGSTEAKNYENAFGVRVLCGEEKLTDAGDIIALGITEHIKSKSWVEVLDEIRDQDGISILPHPYRGHRFTEKIAQVVDFIETWNSRAKPLDNIRAQELATRLSKHYLAGSDAHLYSEIGNATVTLMNMSDLKKGIILKYSKKYEKAISYIIGRARIRFSCQPIDHVLSSINYYSEILF
jgi:hypothetical protein